MSKIIITGATGNAGSAVLSAAIASPDISHITVLARRPPYETSPKVEYIQIPSNEYPKGFDGIDEEPGLVERLRGSGACIWALGVSQTQVDEKEYYKITHDYTLKAAKAFSALGTEAEPFRFVFMSAEGARQDEKGWSAYSRVKGKTERELAAMASKTFAPLSVRPAGINPTKEHSTRMHWLWGPGLRTTCAALKVVYPPMVVDASHLGKVCVSLAGGRGWDQMDVERVVSNVKLRKMI
ncbi:hypothetical protein L202_03081 [Cryptococcus amylolentus CBS 6039]|uniref:NAD(P)-binding domain-containing protein n=2 Tax=Cryptococcus amylolentus TaxID=104669 RepID=A0A1E3HXF8_9TREE|nr:hypothetical protein L202_03081 [Cryptococcus amylolentus CBS 6039]ODN80969.1 hypothetical protein L202_03081 [Cryptococcus amylolentus CBS 6039]ODO09450.1 hypothetical protein I350_03050 [Cryptococcus amylolentus CBS 6273]